MVFELIAFLVLCGIAKALALELETKASNEYQLFLNKSKQYTNSIRKAKEEIEREIRHSNMQRFHELCNLHYRSIQIANHAKQALDHAKNTLNVFYDTRRKVYVNMDKLSNEYSEQRSIKNWHRVDQIRKEQSYLKELKNGLHDQIDIIKEKRESFYSELKDLNSKTRDLKYHIKNLGPGGEEWFRRLENRTTQRRLSRQQWRF